MYFFQKKLSLNSKYGIFFHIMKIDETDLSIIEILRRDASLSTKEISKKIRIPITTIHNRIKKLKQEGVIQRYTIAIDEKKLGKLIYAYIATQLNS